MGGFESHCVKYSATNVHIMHIQRYHIDGKIGREYNLFWQFGDPPLQPPNKNLPILYNCIYSSSQIKVYLV